MNRNNPHEKRNESLMTNVSVALPLRNTTQKRPVVDNMATCTKHDPYYWAGMQGNVTDQSRRHQRV